VSPQLLFYPQNINSIVISYIFNLFRSIYGLFNADANISDYILWNYSIIY
jgi:hypothetical protein